MATKQPLSREQQELVEKNWLLIYGGIKKYWKEYYHLDKEEMEAHFGYMLCRAAQTYNSQISKFSTWAYVWFYKGYVDLTYDRDRRGIVGGREKMPKPSYVSPNFTDDSMEIVQACSATVKAREESKERYDDLRDMQKAYQRRRRRLNPQQTAVIEARMNGDTLKVIGDRYGISKERVRQVEEAAIKLLRR